MNSSASAPSRTTCTLLARLCFLNACSASSSSFGLSSTSRISTPLSVIGRSLFEGEGKRRAPVGLGFAPHPAAVAADDPLHDGQAHARAVEVGRAVQPLEDAEQFVG